MSAVLPATGARAGSPPPLPQRASSVTRRLLLAVFCLAALALLLAGPIAQPKDYHAFADTRTLLGVPYALDVLSNLPFLGAGLWLLLAARAWQRSAHPGAAALALAGAASLLTGLGSGYYHWAPANWGLLWDRLPIGVTAVGLLAVLLAEHVDARWSRPLPLAALTVAALASSAFWYLSTLWGAEDLRPYLLAQFSPMIALVVLAPGMRGGFLPRTAWLLAAAGYALAKVCEVLDERIFHWSGELIAGHTLKHLFAALALCVLAAWAQRSARQPGAPG